MSSARSRAPHALKIHLNTVHHRLAALDELLPGWQTPARVLDIHTALRLWKLDGRWGC